MAGMSRNVWSRVIVVPNEIPLLHSCSSLIPGRIARLRGTRSGYDVPIL